ncbi:uncharacterized protein N7498_008031 [Penicillium cinerascens]|uniref:Uncharacterized protein n=1 Tax=Penicillium cinerascens TaxID=70096 RepID=A0A9W9JCM3_9EURO|nr:uncharacterized protein N7498_008031 [Penicillium cinerascens]KAJ5194593.1 hypothetical protein N7498_008031 [Penicillium cinerascens]
MSLTTGVHSTAQGAFVKAFSIWQDKQRSHLRSTADKSIKGAMAIEVQWSETRAKLKADAKFWLDESKGDVSVVITVSISSNGKISIERWNLSQQSGDPFPTQTMAIERLPDGPRITGEMKVNFCDIFLRDKQAAESDFEISHDNLIEMADDVWLELDLWNAARRGSTP